MSETATCPKCGFERAPGAVECPACGIIYARFDPERAAHRRIAAVAAAPGEQLYDPMQPAAGLDPYRAPSAILTGRAAGVPATEPARRFTRLAAQILDNLIAIGVMFITLGPIFVFTDFENDDPGAFEAVFFGAFVLALIALVVVNLYYLHRDGQTLGKKALSIRIVRMNDERASLGRIFALRMLVPGLFGAVPIVGPFFALADPLFIFGEARRCIHDYIADTKVVVA